MANGITVHWLTGSDLTEAVWDAFFDFYMDTGSRKWGRPYLTREFYSLVGAEDGRPHRADDGQARRPLDRRRHQLHRRRTRCSAATGAPSSITRSCISSSATTRRSNSRSRTSSRRVEAGAQGEHKIARGYLPKTTHSAHYIADPALRRAIADYLMHERAYIAAAGAEMAAMAPLSQGFGSRSGMILRLLSRAQTAEGAMPSYDPNNIFAKILRGELPAHKVYEDDKAIAFLDIMPQAPGHMLVVPKSPARTILDIAPDDLAHAIKVAQKIAKAAVPVFDADG